MLRNHAPARPGTLVGGRRVEQVPAREGYRELVHRWLERFGPGTEEDVYPSPAMRADPGDLTYPVLRA